MAARRSVRDTLPLNRRHLSILILTTLETPRTEIRFLIIPMIFPFVHARTVPAVRSFQRRPPARLFQHALRLPLLIFGRATVTPITSRPILSGRVTIAKFSIVHPLQRCRRRAGATSARVAPSVRGEPLMSRVALG